MSPRREIRARRRPTSTSTRSPASWPSESLIDLEIVEVDEQHGDPPVGAVQRQEGLGQAVHQRQPVGQPGDGVVQSLVG